MIGLFILIFFCSIFAYGAELRSRKYPTVRTGISKDWQAALLYILMLIPIILFAALRTTYNDTSTYMYGFTLVDENDLRLSEFFEPYGGFEVYQKVIKHFISDDPQALIVVTAIILNILFISFIARYSKKFALSIYLYLIGNYIFGMAGMKQALAMAVSLLAIENMVKKKYIRALLWLLFACTFHPYIICLIILPLLTEKVWNKKTILILLVSVICISNLENILTVVGNIGKDYTITEMTNSTINPMRVLVESIPAFIAILFKKQINDSKDKMLVLGANMEIIQFFFIAAGLFFNPIYMARIGTYFSSVSAVTTPLMLVYAFRNSRNAKLYYRGYYVIFSIYFILDMTKLGSISIFTDLFHHIGLF